MRDCRICKYHCLLMPLGEDYCVLKNWIILHPWLRALLCLSYCERRNDNERPD